MAKKKKRRQKRGPRGVGSTRPLQIKPDAIVRVRKLKRALADIDQFDCTLSDAVEVSCRLCMEDYIAARENGIVTRDRRITDIIRAKDDAKRERDRIARARANEKRAARHRQAEANKAAWRQQDRERLGETRRRV